MKRILVLLCLLALIPIACAGPTADSLSVSSASGNPGDISVPVLLNITNTAEGPIQGIAFDVIYDHDVLELVKARRGSDLPTDDGEPTWAIKLGKNQQSVTMYTDDQAFALSDGTTGNIAKLQFNVNATANPDDYPIGLSATVSDTSAIVGIVPVINGTFTVIGPVLCTDPDPPSNDFGNVSAGETRTWTFDITNSGTGTLDWTVVDDQDWITVSPESGSDAGTVTVTINTTGLAEGAYDGTVNVSSNGGTKEGIVSVTVLLDSVDPVLCTTPDPPSNDFGNVPEGKTRTWSFDVKNCGEGTLDWTVSGDQTWITVNPAGGSTTTEADTVTVTVDTTGLSDDMHTGTVTVSSDYGTNVGTISVDVKDPAPLPSGAVVTIPDVSATGLITVPITIENVSNVGSCQLTLSYDPDVVIVSNASQSDFDSLFTNLEDAASGSVSLLAYQTSNPGRDGDAIIAEVTFTTVGNSGSSTPLDIEVTTLTDATPDCNPIPYTILDGSFTTFLNGDVNGDGMVDVSDCMFLAKHLIGVSGFETIVEDAADVNGNGEIEASDCMYLAKHLAGIDGFEVLK